jgi:hypothetical protein
MRWSSEEWRSMRQEMQLSITIVLASTNRALTPHSRPLDHKEKKKGGTRRGEVLGVCAFSGDDGSWV